MEQLDPNKDSHLLAVAQFVVGIHSFRETAAVAVTVLYLTTVNTLIAPVKNSLGN